MSSEQREPQATALDLIEAAIRVVEGPNMGECGAKSQLIALLATAKWRAAEEARLLAAAPDMLKALEDLFEHCAMIHKHWGEGDNTRQANAAEALGRTAILKAKGC